MVNPNLNRYLAPDSNIVALKDFERAVVAALQGKPDILRTRSLGTVRED